LQRNLASQGYLEKPVPGDNNCQFHALADQLAYTNWPGWKAMTVRQQCVAWLKANGDTLMDNDGLGESTRLKDAVGVPNWNHYIQDMLRHGTTWGDEATLLAACVLYKAEIFIISSVGENSCHTVEPPPSWHIKVERRLVIGHYHEYHYISTRKMR